MSAEAARSLDCVNEEGLENHMVVFTSLELGCGAVEQLYLEYPGERFKCGDIIRVPMNGMTGPNGVYEKYVVLGYIEGRHIDYYDYVGSDKPVIVCVGIGDKNIERVRDYIDEDGHYLWEKGTRPEALTWCVGVEASRQIKNNGEVTDVFPDFEPTREFFESLSFNTMEMTDREKAAYERVKEVRGLFGEYTGLIRELASSKPCIGLVGVMGVENGDNSRDDMFDIVLAETVKHSSSEELASFFEIMAFVEKVDAFFKKSYAKRFRMRLEYNGFSTFLDSLAVLDALAESGDRQALELMVSCIGDNRRWEDVGIWFDLVRLFEQGDLAVFDRVIEIMGDRGEVLPVVAEEKKTPRDFYENPLFFASPPEFPEVPLNVLQHGTALVIEGATGCPKAASGNPCKFCTNTLKEAHFKKVDIATFVRRVAGMSRDLHPMIWKSTSKVFLTGADLLALSPEDALSMIRIVKKGCTASNKIEAFATVKSVIENRDRLAELKKAGLSLLYIGGECGDDQTLADMNKQQTCGDIVEACRLLEDNGINVSMFLMPGLGGIARSNRIAHANAELIFDAQPRFVNVLPVTNAPAEWQAAINAEDGNRPMTPEEIRDEIDTMLNLLDTRYDCGDWGETVRVEAYKPEDVSKAAVTPLVFKAEYGPEGNSLEIDES